MNGLKIIKPINLIDSMLISTDVPENDYAAWSSATTYSIGQRVILTSTHRIYESLQSSNLNKNPTSNPTYWANVAPTNRWAAFDTINSTQTKQSTALSYRIKPGKVINSVVAVNLSAATTFRVRLIDPTFGTVYDKTVNMAPTPTQGLWWGWFFSERLLPPLPIVNDLPAYPNADIMIDVNGTTDLGVGVLIFGQIQTIGLSVLAGARLGITDYSRKETDVYGETILTQRQYSKRASYNLIIEKQTIDNVFNSLTLLRATPCLWIGNESYNASVTYGFYKSFDIAISYPTFSECSLEIEGLT